MFVFLFVGIVTFGLVSALIAVREQVITKANLKYVRIAIDGVFKIFVRQSIIIGFTVLSFLGLVAVVIVITISNTLPIYSTLYQTQEFLTSDQFSKGLLGFVFGGLLATWAARTYNISADSKLSFIQKLEGGAILLIFVLGTTTISLEDFIRGFQIDGGKINFQLAAALSSNEGKSGDEAIALESGKPNNGNNSQNSSLDGLFLDGFRLIKATSGAMARDLVYIKEFSNSNETSDQQNRHDKIKDKYKEKIAPLINCIYSLLEFTGDRRHFYSEIAPLRAPLGAVYLNLLQLDKFDPKKLKSANSSFDLAAQALSRDLIRFAASLPKENLCKGLKWESIGLPVIKAAAVELRPYIATIYSSLLYMDGQREQAIYILNDAIKLISEKTPAGAPSIRRSMPEFWYTMRATFNFIYMVEDYIEQEGQKTPIRIRELYLSRLQKYSEYLRRIDGKIPDLSIFGYYKIDNIDGRTLSGIGFSRDPGFKQRCPEANEFQKPVSMITATVYSYIFIHTQAFFVYRAIEHPDFGKKYAKLSGDIVENIVNVDLNCAAEIGLVSRSALLLQRAEYLYIYARYQLKLAELKRKIGPEYESWMRAKLVLAQNSSNLALEITEKSSDDPSIKSTDISQRTELQGKLQRLIQYTDAWLDRFK